MINKTIYYLALRDINEETNAAFEIVDKIPITS